MKKPFLFLSVDDLRSSWAKTEFRLALFLLLTYLSVGGVAFSLVFPIDPAHPDSLENTTFTDALYFTVVSLTTVGYGDLAPQTTPGKVFTSFFLFLGVSFIATCLGIVVGIALDQENALAEASLEVTLTQDLTGSNGGDGVGGGAGRLDEGDQWAPIRRRLLLSVFNIVVFLSLGTVSFTYIEGRSLTNAFYWSCVTITTCGYGDMEPSSLPGRLFAIFFIAIGTVVIAQCLGDISSIPLQMRRQRVEGQVMRQFGDTLEEEELLGLANGDYMSTLGLSQNPDYCTRAEFTLAMLIKLGKINTRDLAGCYNQFSQLDHSGDGRLDGEDLQLARRRRETRAFAATVGQHSGDSATCNLPSPR